ncbi:hypothetical protein P691DRAFT_73000 [Macrolepiota fuliginosa MF-IS2]|uniref:Uncharacterized protein n=1 Tax=Macrolepiota fuliginosa MF-IS2 TaxID=1400762 RepID=A0A9P5XBN9_9AGAR|nr:hypothetical protein P691DRAFT_73000 [Macrolepiota fuliginosa MF-IS2]
MLTEGEGVARKVWTRRKLRIQAVVWNPRAQRIWQDVCCRALPCTSSCTIMRTWQRGYIPISAVDIDGDSTRVWASRGGLLKTRTTKWCLLLEHFSIQKNTAPKEVVELVNISKSEFSVDCRRKFGHRLMGLPGQYLAEWPFGSITGDRVVSHDGGVCRWSLVTL